MRNSGDSRLILSLTIAFIFYPALSAELPRLASGLAHYRLDNAPILLIGEWERYNGSPTEAQIAEGLAPEYAPATLNRSIFGSPLVPEGELSYRARISLDPPSAVDAAIDRRMALYFPGIQDFRSAFIDGRLVYEKSSGSPPPSILFFEATGQEVSILLRSGPGDRRLESATLLPAFGIVGDEEGVLAIQLFLVSGAMIVPAIFAMSGFSLFVLFLFWRKNAEFLSFSLYSAILAAYYFIKHARLFGSLTHGMDQGWLESACIAAFALQYVGLAAFFLSVFRGKAPKLVRIVAAAFPAAAAAAALLLPGSSPIAYVASIVYASLAALAFIVALAILAFKGDRKARWLLPPFLLATTAVAAPRIFRESLVNSYFIEPIGIAIFTFACALMLIKKVGDTFESAEALTDYVSSVSRTVKSFIPKEFLEHLDKTDVIDLKLGDHAKKEMTIFFSDIRGFTELSEKLTVEENFAFINSYLARMVPVVKENGGFVDKYVGDAIMALFPGPDGADGAIRAAIAMQSKIVEYNVHRARSGYSPISMGVGIHTGDLMLGVVGVSDRMENTVISDSVNLASRLQAITKAFNIALAISERSFKELDDPGAYKYRFIGKVKVKGKAAPVSIFEIFDGIAPELFERKMKANMFFEQGMLSYYEKDFAGAVYYFKRVLDVMPEDGASIFYLDNCMKKAAL